ncbi:MAG: Rne/Rng family ribonuclease, partial [Rhodobacteraceae bacterium]|nr:Rne/Rng family ribonuclease [Paracoccaceae bacterium]
MAKKMLIDATHAEETRVVVVDGNKVEEFDFESENKRQLAGNIYLAKVTRVEPSLQAAFVDYGGNRHGFLAFSEIHPDYYQIPVADREALMAEEAAYDKSMSDAEDGDDEKPSKPRRSRTRRRKSDKAGAAPETNGDAPAAGAITGMDVVDLADESDDDAHEPMGFDREVVSDESQTPASVDDIAAEEVPAAATGDDAAPELAAVTAEVVPAELQTAEPVALEPAPEAVVQDVAPVFVEEPVAVAEDAVDAAPETPVDEDAVAADAVTAEDEDDDSAQTQPGSIAASTPSDVVTSELVENLDDDADGADLDQVSQDPPSTEDAAEEPIEAGDDDGDGPAENPIEEVEPVEGDDQIEAVSDDDTVEEIRPPRRPRPRRYKIQEVIKVRQILLVQVVKEERGNKGAALTTYLSLAGRYCVLMPNTARGGGISRKITNVTDRKKLKQIAAEIDIPKGAGLIIRTAGAKRTKAEIKRDYEYLQRLWEQIRELTLKSVAPAKIYEEGDLIKRSIRDLYNREIDEVFVEGEAGYRSAKDFMKMIMPSHAKNVKHYAEPMPLFARYQVEAYLSEMFNPVVKLKSGGYIVIGVTEALVAVDVNSGKATKEGSIEETALKTNLEAAEEVARQMRLRDLAGLIVIDFIDMEERKNNAA